MAHINSDIGIRRAVEHGVRSIEHGNFLSDAMAQAMAERGARLVPTLVTYEADAKTAPASAGQRKTLPRIAKLWPPV